MRIFSALVMCVFSSIYIVCVLFSALMYAHFSPCEGYFSPCFVRVIFFPWLVHTITFGPCSTWVEFLPMPCANNVWLTPCAGKFWPMPYMGYFWPISLAGDFWPIFCAGNSWPIPYAGNFLAMPCADSLFFMLGVGKCF